MRDHFGNGQDRRGRHPFAVQRCYGFLAVRHGVEPRFDGLDQFPFVVHAVAIGQKTRVFNELRVADGACHALPLVVEHADDDHVAVARLEDAARRQPHVMRAAARGHEPAARGAVRLDRKIVRVDVGVEQRHVDVLPLARPLAVQQGAGDGAESVHAGAHVADRSLRHGRRPAPLAGHFVEPGIRLRDVVVAGNVRQRPGLPERRNRTHDKAWVEFLQHVVGETEPAHRTRTVVFDHHVHVGNQVADDLAPLIGLEVDAQALFADVVLDEIAAAALLQNAVQASRVTFGRLFDLDDLGAHFG